jgi:hypothetical protein
LTDVIVVDVANVMGSRPDGWWRDRAGAARRLYDDVKASGQRDVVLVLEGAARAGVEAGDAGGVRVVHAAGSGDDAVVQAVTDAAASAADDAAGGGGTVMVVTSDRELRRRVRELGADVAGPGWFRERLT